MTRPWLPLLAALLVAPLGCKWRMAADHTGPMILNTYDVPKGQAARIRESLRAVLWLSTGDKDGQWVGRVDNLPNNQLLVLAPLDIQIGVKELLAAAASHPYPDEKTTELRYWLVVGKKSAQAGPPALGIPEIQPALETIVREGGAQELSLVETARVASFTNHEGNLEAQKLKIRQTATNEGETVWANIAIEFYGSPRHDDKIDTRVRLTPGQTIVLGAGGYGETGDGSVLYYLVRAVAPLGT